MRFLTLFINLDYLRRQILHPTTQCIATTKGEVLRAKVEGLRTKDKGAQWKKHGNGTPK